ncbi:hypothetical protein KPATCC21470_2658 [Kitasatospora purpeofusca]
MVKSFGAGGSDAGLVAGRARLGEAAVTCGFLRTGGAFAAAGRAPAHPLRRGWR